LAGEREETVTHPASGPEQKARTQIDAALVAAGWIVQDRDEMNLSAGRGVAVREFKLTTGHGFADYLLFVDGKAVGVLEAKPEGHTLSGVEVQAEKYSTGLPAGLDPPVAPLPFLYLSTGAITKFTNLLDPIRAAAASSRCTSRQPSPSGWPPKPSTPG